MVGTLKLVKRLNSEQHRQDFNETEVLRKRKVMSIWEDMFGRYTIGEVTT